jgi:hypothetical protein
LAADHPVRQLRCIDQQQSHSPKGTANHAVAVGNPRNGASRALVDPEARVGVRLLTAERRAKKEPNE